MRNQKLKREGAKNLIKSLRNMQNAQTFNSLKTLSRVESKAAAKSHLKGIDETLNLHRDKIIDLMSKIEDLKNTKTSKVDFDKMVDSLDKHRAISIYKDMQLYVDEVLSDFKRDQAHSHQQYTNLLNLFKSTHSDGPKMSTVFTSPPQSLADKLLISTQDHKLYKSPQMSSKNDCSDLQVLSARY